MNNSKDKFTGLINKSISPVTSFQNFLFTGQSSPNIPVTFDISNIIIELELLAPTGTVLGTPPFEFYSFENGVYKFSFRIFVSVLTGPISRVSFPLNFPVRQSQTGITPNTVIYNYDDLWDIEIKAPGSPTANTLVVLRSKKSIFDSQAAFASSQFVIFLVEFNSTRYYTPVVAPFSAAEVKMRMFAVLKS